MTMQRYARLRVGRALDATLSRAGDWLTTWGRQAISLIAGQDSYIWSIDTDGTRSRMLDTDPDQAMLNLLNPVIHACVKARCDALTAPTFVVERRQDDGTYVAEPDHPLSRLIMRPSPTLDTGGFWRCLEVSYSSMGRLYLEPLRTQRRRDLDGLNPLNPAWMIEEVDGDGNLILYRYEVPGIAPVTFRPDELITRRAVMWADPPPLYVALGPVLADETASQFVSGFLAGGGVPSAIIKTRDDWDQDRADAFRAEWMRRFTPGNKIPAILGRSIESYEKIGVGLDELDTESTRMLIETRMCQAYGVPPLIIYSMAGLVRSIQSNLAEAWESFWDATALPLCKDWSTWVRWSLLTLFEDPEDVRSGAVRVRFDVTGIGPYQEDTALKTSQYLEGFKAGTVTENEHRGTLGLPPKAGGDLLPRERPQEPIPPTQPNQPDDTPDGDEEDKAILYLRNPQPATIIPAEIEVTA